MNVNKNAQMLGMGIMTILGFVFGLVMFLLLYNWYLVGFADPNSVLMTGIILAIVMYIFLMVAYKIGKKYGLAYQKAIWVGIGFTIALIVATIVMGYLGLSASVSVSALALAQRKSIPCGLRE